MSQKEITAMNSGRDELVGTFNLLTYVNAEVSAQQKIVPSKIDSLFRIHVINFE